MTGNPQDTRAAKADKRDEFNVDEFDWKTTPGNHHNAWRLNPRPPASEPSNRQGLRIRKN
jgi:hypothetical protein